MSMDDVSATQPINNTVLWTVYRGMCGMIAMVGPP